MEGNSVSEIVHTVYCVKKAPSQLQLLSTNVIDHWKTQQGLENTFHLGRPSQITEEIGFSLNEHLKKDDTIVFTGIELHHKQKVWSGHCNASQ